jgi:hypothetical protein
MAWLAWQAVAVPAVASVGGRSQRSEAGSLEQVVAHCGRECVGAHAHATSLGWVADADATGGL